MNKRISLVGALLSLSTLAGCGIIEQDRGSSSLMLPPCSNLGNVFGSSRAETMQSAYHGTVANVINAHINDLADINTQLLQCTANEFRGLVEPSSALTDLARLLPEWGPSRPDVSEADLAAILLEYLRVYECSLQQRGQFLSVFILREQGQFTTQPDGSEIQFMPSSDLTEQQEKESAIIAHELSTARPILERTLAFLGNIDRFRPLSAELECLKRASLDLRNAMGLLAESASCMPKIWDARGSLRDLPD